jgi:surface carbohydrate biosynthesis protein (TIGR04326 family)
LFNGLKKNCELNLVYVLDAKSIPHGDAFTTVLWRSYSEDCHSNVISIPQQVEINADRLRMRYLAWIHDLGEMRVSDMRVVDHLLLRPDFSYWWMTQIAEKCNFEKSPLIDDAIRFMAFEDWALGQQIDGVELSTANYALAECMRVWCEKKAIPFTLIRLKAPGIKLSWLRRIYSLLPQVMQALVWLIHYLVVRWPFRGVGLKEWRSSQGKVTLVSYLFNLVPEAITQDRFESRYWGPLPRVLQADNSVTNWLHIYVKDDLLPTARRAAKLLGTWNKIRGGLQYHVALDSFLGPRVVLRTLRDWGYLMRSSIRIRRLLPKQKHPESHLWPFLAEDWSKSMFGVAALNNLLFFNLFESAFEGQTTQNHGVYLEENQGWEFGLIYAWKAAGHKMLIGSPHSTVRFWDLRYFFDLRNYYRTGKNDLPLPDLVACNGPAMRKAMELSGYPKVNLIDVEALRYLQLLGLEKKNFLAKILVKKIRILVIGDYLLKNTQLQMRLLEEAVQLLKIDVTIFVKLHPACPINFGEYPNITFQLSKKSITELMRECDVAYSSVLTSGAVDAYCGGMPIVVAMDPSMLNLSPLRGYGSVTFASTPEELAEALVSANVKSRNEDEEIKFFNLDLKVERWRRLLQKSGPLNT